MPPENIKEKTHTEGVASRAGGFALALPKHRKGAMPGSNPQSSFILILAMLLGASAAGGQKKPDGPPPETKDTQHATVIHATPIYIQGNATSDKIGTVTPGREMIISERSDHWIRVYANTDIETVREQDVPVFSNEQAQQPISGWIQDKGVVDSNTPQGDAILFGEAVSTEQAATEPHAPATTAEDARRLYRMSANLFPQAPHTAEALWRAADIRWQLQKADAATLPSAHEKENYLRQQMDESEMKKLQKYFPKSKWADYAAYAMIENKLCGDWQGSEKCPEQEAGYYVKYVDEHPDSPRNAEALYKAAWRLANAGDMWVADGEQKKADEDRAHAIDLAGRLQSKYPQAEYAARGAGLVYKVQQSIPIYGSDRE